MNKTAILSFIFTAILSANLAMQAQEIPLPEHPRPDFQREQWQNLNGLWSFEFDANDEGIEKRWFEGKSSFTKNILVPFPWGSNLSRVEDEADIAWYKRKINVDPAWKDKRVFVTIGASDWETSVWLDGQLLGTHQGGYVPFSFELTDHVKRNQSQELVIRVDDARRDFTLYGKQGYGNARGIWQTIYLEARGKEYIDALHFSPDIDKQEAKVTVWLAEKSNR
nr:glycoside hydrolase family 2 [Bacteroidales bacterium]